MKEKPRYSRISDIIDLAIFMQSKFQGVTIAEIMERYNISRRTAERMRDSLTCIFPQIDEIVVNDNQKHWGFINYSINNLINFSPKEIANIEQIQRRTTNNELKEELKKTVDKLKALNRKNNSSLEKNIELIMQTVGYAVRQTPQHKIEFKILDTIREGIQNSKILNGIYHNKERFLEPLGLIYGEKTYLVAREKAKGEEIYTYLLHKFESLKLTNENFDKKGFNLEEYTNLSFGVYHGEILDVKLSFDKDLADEASKYNFHPTQKIKKEKNGTLTVKFKASGSKEIMWHVFKWGKGCKILAPKTLMVEYRKYLNDCLNNS